jgi:hypothetical protein
MCPVERFSVKVHYRKDYQFVVSFVVMVNNPVRETTNNATAHIHFDKGPHFRMHCGSLYCRIHFGRKLIP